MDTIRTSGARWAWLLAGTFLIATVIVALMNLNITTAPLQVADDASLPDQIFANFAAARAAWLQDAGSAVLYAVGFLAIAALGPILQRLLGREDPRSMRVALLFVVAGVVGILSQLIYIGGKEVATAPYYCDCTYASEQLISRGAILDVLVSIQDWMVSATMFVFALGLFSTAALARAERWPGRFTTVTSGLAVAGFAAVGWNRVAVPILAGAGLHIRYDLIGLGILALIAGIGVPTWAVLLGRTLSEPDGAP